MVNAFHGVIAGDSIQKIAEAAANKNSGWAKITIDGDAFKLSQEGASADNIAADYAEAAKQLTSACFMLIKEGQEKWALVTYLPTNTEVQERAVLCASAPNVKSGVGPTNKVVRDLQITDAAQCTCGTSSRMNPLHSHAEQLLHTQAAFTEDPGYGPWPAVCIPELTLEAPATAAIQAFKADAVQVVVMGVDPAASVVVLIASEASGLEEAAAMHLTGPEARLVLVCLKEDHLVLPVKRNVLISFVPKEATPTQKVVYANGKMGLAAQLPGLGLNPFLLECMDGKELTVRHVMDEICPKVTSAPPALKKPRQVHRKGKARLVGKPKFQGS